MGIEEIIFGAVLGGIEEGGAAAGIGAGLAEGGAEAALGAGGFAGEAAGAIGGVGGVAGELGGAAELAGFEGVSEGAASSLGGSLAGEASSSFGFGEAAAFADPGLGGTNAEFGGDLSGFSNSFDEAGFGSSAGFDDFAQVPGMENPSYQSADQWMSPNNTDFNAGQQLQQYQPGPGQEAGVQTNAQGDIVDQNYQNDPYGTQQQGPRGPGGGNNAANAAARSPGGGGLGQALSGLSKLAGLGGGPSKPSSAASALYAQLQAQGQQLIDNYNQGILDPSLMAKFQVDLQGQKNQINQFYANSGNFNSTARIQALREATLKTTAAMAASLQQELQQGLQALGQAGQGLTALSQQAISADNAYRSSLMSALGSLGQGLGGIGGGAGSGAGNNQQANSGGSPFNFNDSSQYAGNTGGDFSGDFGDYAGADLG